MRRAVTSPAELIFTVESTDQINSDVAEEALKVIQSSDNDGWKFGRSPASYAAAAVYAANARVEPSSDMTQKEIGDMFGVSAVTLRKRLSELYEEDERQELREKARA